MTVPNNEVIRHGSGAEGRSTKSLEIVMIGEPKGGEFEALRKAGRGFGVGVSNAPIPVVEEGASLWALETWKGQKALDLSIFRFPQRMVLITGTTNRGLDEEWRDVIDGSIYIDQGQGDGSYLSVPTAGAIVMWEFHKQRGLA